MLHYPNITLKNCDLVEERVPLTHNGDDDEGRYNEDWIIKAVL